MGPDANGMGPDGKPWDPERRAKRQAERADQVNSGTTGNVEAQTPSAAGSPSDSPTE
jgi:hypothetical protein